jgi:glutamate racemase
MQKPDLKKLLNKKKITIVITDSGLGGISVLAGIEKKLRETRSFEEVNLIFFNALPEKGTGYNSMPSIEIKAGVFNEALLSMEEKFSPDLILIACNTLSIVYPFTRFVKNSKTPVVGIVEFGVEMILSEMKKHSYGELIILGTQTTISSGIHKKMLVENGISENRIIPQACPNLESEIQDSPESERVKELISFYLQEALRKLNSKSEPIKAALCCTHYGFSFPIFYSILKKLTDREFVILNPNEMMIDSMVLEEKRHSFLETRMNVRVVSRAVIDDDEKKSIGGLINSYAPLSSVALSGYDYNPELFTFSRGKDMPDSSTE